MPQARGPCCVSYYSFALIFCLPEYTVYTLETQTKCFSRLTAELEVPLKRASCYCSGFNRSKELWHAREVKRLLNPCGYADFLFARVSGSAGQCHHSMLKSQKVILADMIYEEGDVSLSRVNMYFA
jgi:hypothetical protein